MHSEDLTALFAGIAGRLQGAAAAPVSAPTEGATGEDPDGFVRVTVDARGILGDIVYDDAIDELDADELASAVLAATNAAYAAARGARTTPVADLGRSEFSAAAWRAMGMGAKE
ncbi:YbaB/EbfC family nucleoid-associated protein [Microbacterium sp. Marseille-Q6965]|uniref:YbaB/EbfC family nucleoid-associated protein n=1 Tax=Microbacterium sp. Marseille-Q6965 TaxID=2965072 RepID=UPI0021B83A9A|nr:YbaB/EbfC family nucleoid-associated protein [Microbacterium sp. Marseille-Q6965]